MLRDRGCRAESIRAEQQGGGCGQEFGSLLQCPFLPIIPFGSVVSQHSASVFLNALPFGIWAPDLGDLLILDYSVSLPYCP